MLDYLSRTANRNPHKTGVSGSNPESPTNLFHSNIHTRVLLPSPPFTKAIYIEAAPEML